MTNKNGVRPTFGRNGVRPIFHSSSNRKNRSDPVFKRHRHEIEFLALAVILFLIWYLGRFLNINTQVMQRSLREFPLVYSGALYIALYCIVTFFVLFSKDVFWVTGALLFGPFLSTLFICIAEVINAFVLFYLGRFLGRAYIEKNLPERYRHLDEKLGRINFFWLFMFRAAPLIPYRFLDLAAGLTRLSFKKYLAAVILGSPVKMFWIQYILFGVGNNIFNSPYALVDYFLANKALLILSAVYVVFIGMVIFKIRKK